MDYVKPWLVTEGYAKFQEAKTLSEETSKSDPETDPYCSKYKAREILKGLRTNLKI